MRLVHADAIVTGDGPTLKDAAVLLALDGTIEEVGPARELLAAYGGRGIAVERIRGVVLPGLVNAHTHVELSALHGKVRGGTGFLQWADEMLGVRGELDQDESVAAIEGAVEALTRFGTVAVGEVTNTLGAVAALARAGIGGSIFHEVFGVARDGAIARTAALAHDVEERLSPWPSADLAYAPSPHTLYTTHPEAVRRLLALSRERNTRATLHLLEHAPERRAIESGDGEGAAWVVSRVGNVAGFVWPNMPVLDYATGVGALAPDVILVHLTVATAPELARIAAAGSPVVLCPRSNWTIERAVPPLDAMLAAGLAPALGTDSLASSPSLDVLAEAKSLRDRFPHVPSESLLRMATWNGACALDRRDLGRIQRGARPGLFAIEVPVESADANDHVLAHLDAPRRWIARRADAKGRAA